MAGKLDVAKKADVKDAQVQAVFDAIVEITKSGEKVSIQGFGTFEKQHKEARTGRNPRTGESVAIGAKDKLHFKPSPKLEMTTSNCQP